MRSRHQTWRSNLHVMPNVAFSKHLPGDSCQRSIRRNPQQIKKSHAGSAKVDDDSAVLWVPPRLDLTRIDRSQRSYELQKKGRAQRKGGWSDQHGCSRFGERQGSDFVCEAVQRHGRVQTRSCVYRFRTKHASECLASYSLWIAIAVSASGSHTSDHLLEINCHRLCISRQCFFCIQTTAYSFTFIFDQKNIGIVLNRSFLER